MKYIFIVIIIFCFERLSCQTSIYSISITGLKGQTINLSDYKGKKIMIAAATPAILQNGYLSFLDSLQAVYPSVAVIALPALDFGGTDIATIMDNIKNDSLVHVSLTPPSLVKKENGNNQNRLMQWLTNDTENTHFNVEVLTDNQLYLVSKEGFLYAVLEKNVPLAVIDNLLKQ